MAREDGGQGAQQTEMALLLQEMRDDAQERLVGPDPELRARACPVPTRPARAKTLQIRALMNDRDALGPDAFPVNQQVPDGFGDGEDAVVAASDEPIESRFPRSAEPVQFVGVMAGQDKAGPTRA